MEKTIKQYHPKPLLYTLKKQKGVTLIALVITIIILLILAGITISAITGGENTIDKANKSKQSLEVKQEIEKLQRLITNSATKGIKHGNFSGRATVEDIIEVIQKNYDNATILNNKFPLNVIIDSNTYYINREGQVNSTGYIEKEYLKSTGTQYIDTLVYPSSSIDIEMTLKTDVNSMKEKVTDGSNGFFGVNGYYAFNFGSTKDEKNIYLWKRNSSSNPIKFNTNTFNPCNTITISCIDNSFYVNNTLVGTSDYTQQWEYSNESMLLFARCRVNGGIVTFGENMYIYNLKIYENNKLVKNFIPVISQEAGHENEACLFDKVEAKFYYNQGEGTFETN